MAKDTEAERANAASASGGSARPGMASEQTSLSVSTELTAKNIEIARRDEIIDLLEGEMAKLNEIMAAKNAEITQREESIDILETDMDRLIEIVAAKDHANLALSAELAAKNSEIAQREERIGLLEGDATRLNRRGRAVRWVARNIWAWITLKPGTRPRRAARKTVIVLANYVSARRRLAALVKLPLMLVPSLNDRLRVTVYDYKVMQLPTSETDISAEPERVQQLYRRLVQARKHLVEDH